MEIRPLTEADAEPLWHLRLAALETDPQAFATKAAEHRNTSFAEFTARFLEGAPLNAVFGAFAGGRLIAMTGFYRERGETSWRGGIWGVFVLPEFRGRGVGRKLMDAALAHARTVDGLTCVRLEVAFSQHAARKVYVDCGFRPAGAGPHGGEEMVLDLA